MALLSNTACSVVREQQLKSLVAESTGALPDITWSEPYFACLKLRLWMPDEMESITLYGNSSRPYAQAVNVLRDRLTTAGWRFKPDLADAFYLCR